MENKEPKKLVIYYSLEGNTKFIGDAIAKEVGADVLELKLKKPLNPNSFMKYVIGGMKTVFKMKPKLLPYDIDPSNYDMIFIGSPVWASRYVPAFNTFFSKTKLVDKNIALYCCYAGNKGKTLDNFKEILKGNNIVGEIEFKDPLKNNKEDNNNTVREWANKIVFNMDKGRKII